MPARIVKSVELIHICVIERTISIIVVRLLDLLELLLEVDRLELVVQALGVRLADLTLWVWLIHTLRDRAVLVLCLLDLIVAVALDQLWDLVDIEWFSTLKKLLSIFYYRLSVGKKCIDLIDIPSKLMDFTIYRSFNEVGLLISQLLFGGDRLYDLVDFWVVR